MNITTDNILDVEQEIWYAAIDALYTAGMEQ